MPYIHCEMCGTACYSNVLSCPTCGARARLARTRGLVQLAMAGAPGLRGPGLHPPHEAAHIEIEDEVRERLYGWHSGCVELRAGKDVA